MNYLEFPHFSFHKFAKKYKSDIWPALLLAFENVCGMEIKLLDKEKTTDKEKITNRKYNQLFSDTS